MTQSVSALHRAAVQAVEDLVRAALRAPGDSLGQSSAVHALEALTDLSAAVQLGQADLVDRARSEQPTAVAWSTIGTALGTTRQAAQQRYGR